MSTQRQFASVWDAIEDTPQQAASMRARSELLMAMIAGLSPHIAFKRPKAPKKRTPAEAQAA